MPSYPETTALALMGLAGNRTLDLSGALAVARTYLQATRSPLAKAWLAVSLRSHGVKLPPPEAIPLSPGDTMINALEIIAAKGVLA